SPDAIPVAADRVSHRLTSMSRPPSWCGDTLHELAEPAFLTRAAMNAILPGDRRKERLMPSPKKRVAVVGATGIAGQQFLAALDRHPWFDVVKLAASERSAGKTYAAAIRDTKTGAQRWWCAEPPPPAVMHLTVENGDGLDPRGLDILFSGVESEAARLIEPQYAKTT